MDGSLMNKLKILADSAKYDVSCSTSGVERKNVGRIGNSACAGICHSWAADGRCISLLKVLFTNKCVYDCQYCVNRRSVDTERTGFEPKELADLTMEFYRRNYIEGLFLSSAVDISPDYTAERILCCLSILRYDYGFAGYIHAKIIPGVSQELIHAIGMVADRLSVNVEFPTESGLKKLAPQKKTNAIFTPMKQITTTLIQQKSLKGPGTMFKGHNLTLGDGNLTDLGTINNNALIRETRYKYKEKFAPAGQTTQMIIGACAETDKQIVKISESLYQSFKMKRVYFSAYIPISDSPLLPSVFTAPPLVREHRLYQADWLMRFYGFTADEMFTETEQNLDLDLDPKISWALRNINLFPIEVNKASMEEILRIPGIGTTSALRIIRQRKVAAVKYEDMKKMGVVLKRARYFMTCSGKYYGGKDLIPEHIKGKILEPNVIKSRLSPINDETQISMFSEGGFKDNVGLLI